MPDESSAPTVAALYVQTGGVYYGLDDVDPWDEERDARLYDGPWPVVAHPPCATWSIMGNCRPELRERGDDGCFAMALEAVRTFGGVLEHPRYSRAWDEFGLPQPARPGWTQTLFAPHEWTTEVDQAAYGHEVHKPTWLLYVGETPPLAMRWHNADGRRGQHNGVDNLPVRKRLHTPAPFRDVLLALARSTALAPMAQATASL